jgi:rhodanese-related sulfurtransferase
MKIFKHLLLLPLIVLMLAGCAEPPPYTNVDNDELQSLLSQGVPLYDIRRSDEWRSTGVIKGSRRLTFFDAKGNVSPDFLPQFTQRIGKNDPVIVICRTGNRTDALARYLIEKLGYTKVYNVRHGITKWISEEHPVSRI